jgi:chromosome segregation ATPase
MSDKLTPMQKLETAQTEITSLKDQLTAAKAEVAELHKFRNELTESVSKANEALATEKQLHEVAKTELGKAQSDLLAEKTAHQATKDGMVKEIEKQADLKAATIAASQGIPPVKTEVSDKPGSTKQPKRDRKNEDPVSLIAADAVEYMAAQNQQKPE